MPPEKPEQNNLPNQEKPTPESPLHSLRTYQGDIEEIMSKNKTSLSSIVVAEQKRKEVILDLPKTAAHSNIRNKFFIVLGLALFVLGVGANLWVYFTKPSTEVVVPDEKSKTLIGYSEEKIIPFVGTNRTNLNTALTKEKDGLDMSENDVAYLNVTSVNQTPENIATVLTSLTPQIPVSLSRALENKYMFGVYSLAGNQAFIILTTNDYGSAYSGMLAWENNIATDLDGFFGINISLDPASTTSKFVDEAYRNKDLRVLKDKGKKTILLYSFIDKNTLIITTNESVFTGVLGKYLVNKNIR